MTMPESLAAITADLGRPLPGDFHERLRARDRAAFEAGLKALPGVVALLDRLAARAIPYCVASSGSVEKMHHSLGLVGLLPRFVDHMFSARMVGRGKPAPDLFLFAAEKMGASPAGCLVIEDSVHGVTAARAAGMRAIGFVGASHNGPEMGALLMAADWSGDGVMDLLAAGTAAPEVGLMTGGCLP